MLQVQKQCRYRFAPLVDELRDAQTSEYRTTLLSFINCIIISTEKLDERVRIRNEFLGESRDACVISTEKLDERVRIRNEFLGESRDACASATSS